MWFLLFVFYVGNLFVYTVIGLGIVMLITWPLKFFWKNLFGFMKRGY